MDSTIEKNEDEYFLEKRALGELFDSKFDVNVNLFRGRNPNNTDPILHPILKSPSYRMAVSVKKASRHTKGTELCIEDFCAR